MRSMCASRNAKLISPVPGSWRPGTSASCRWPMRGSSRSIVAARFPSMICMWNRSYWINALGAATSSSLRAACQETAGERALAQRLDQQPDALVGETPRGIFQVRHIRGMQARMIRVRRSNACHAMHAPAACGTRVAHCDFQVVAEAGFATRQASGAVLAALRIAARHVVQHDFHARGARPRRELLGLPGVRVLVLDGAKAGVRGRGKAIEKIDLREQHR